MIITRRFLRDRARGFVWWSVAMVCMVGLTIAIFPSIEGDASYDKLIRDLPASIKAMIGPTDVSFSSAPGYLNGRLFASLAPIVVLIYAIGLGARALGGSEEDGTLELVLAQPVTRRRMFGERAVAVTALLFGVNVVLIVAVLVMAPAVGLLDGVSIGGLVGTGAALFLLGALHGAIAFAVGAITGRRSTAVVAATVVAVATYLLYTLAAASSAIRSAQIVTPWHWYLGRNMLVDGVAPDAIIVPLVLIAILFAAGIAVFNRRDLR